MKRTLVLRNLSLLLLVTLLCAPAFAQASQRNLRSVFFIHVKSDQQDAWKAAVKDYAALFKQAGAKQPWTVWESQTGPSQFAVVWYSEKWKELGEDTPELKNYQSQAQAIVKRLMATSNDTEMWIDEMQPDMLINDGKMPPPMVRTARVRVQAGKMEDLKNLIRTELFPAYKKSGVPDFGVAVARFGTPTNEFHTYAAVSSWADFDSPFGPQKGMSDDEWKSFQSKFSALVEGGTEFTVWKFQPDLSYFPAPAK